MGTVMKNTDRLDVLVCGAGPTGLVLALRLAHSGAPVRFRIVDAVAEPGTTSRALVVHARTLEFYRQMGLADALLAESLAFTAVNMWIRGRRVARAVLGEMGKGLSRFPFMVVCPQDRHERFLIEQLRRAGVEVERPLSLVDFTQDGGGVKARLEDASGNIQECEASYLAGCDGARSTVRETLGVGFPGGTYDRVLLRRRRGGHGSGDERRAPRRARRRRLHGRLPPQGGHTARLIGTLRADQESIRESLTWDDVGRAVAERLGIGVQSVNWFSTYRVHHRVAGSFQKSRAFLLGDAAHIHSPVGGQGMNTGIGDAVNLAWKLADVVRGRAPQAPARHLRAGAHGLCATAHRHDRPRLHGRHEPERESARGAHADPPSGASRRGPPHPRAALHVPRRVPDRDRLSGPGSQRGDGRSGGGRRSSALGGAGPRLEHARQLRRPGRPRLAGARVWDAGGRGRRGLRGRDPWPCTSSHGRTRWPKRDSRGTRSISCGRTGMSRWRTVGRARLRWWRGSMPTCRQAQDRRPGRHWLRFFTQ